MTAPLLTALVASGHSGPRRSGAGHPGPGQRITVAGESLSFPELQRAAVAVARSVAGHRRVAVLARPSLETVVAVCGALLAGTEVVPVPPDSGTGELAHLLSDSAAQAWLGPAAPGASLSTTIPVLPALAATPDPGAYAPPALDPESIALILYTSGTTGPPKGVLLSRRAIAAGLDGLIEAWQWRPGDVLAHGLPLFHVHGLILGVLGALRVGSGLIHTGRPTPTAYAEAARAGATMFFGVPTVWSRIAADPDSARALSPARLLISGSAALPAPTHARLRELTGHDVIERYGMSETLITIATRAGHPAEPGTVGQPIAGVQARVVDESGRLVPADGETVGRLEVRGTTLFTRYLNRPEATAAAMTEDGWFRTGDVAAVDADGVHRIVGRESTDLIKSGGYRIGAGEIEAALLGHPAVAECAVLGEPDPDLGQRIVAWVVPQTPPQPEQAEALSEKLQAYVGDQLSAHKRPREVRFVADLPRNEMGKVQKARLSGS